MEKLNSIYAKQNPKLRQILEDAANPRKVLCASIDYAKTKHVVFFCNGLGDILRKSFPVENNPSGLTLLLVEVQKTCHHRGIQAKHVLLAVKTAPLTPLISWTN